MARPERRLNNTPNQNAELARGRYQKVREFADAFIDELFLIKAMKATFPGIEVLKIDLPSDPSKVVGAEMHLWSMLYRDSEGQVCTTTLRKLGGPPDADTFFSLDMTSPNATIHWDMDGGRTVSLT